ncbi:MAG: hypothetical protein IPM22_13820 [Betaproteobacteria bacterium]|nr:hypothetical protein [Betaproteobacteria bacterium]
MQHALPAVAAEPTLAALVRLQTGAAWSRARRLCVEGRVTLNGARCLDPAMRVAAGAVVAVDEEAPKLRIGPLADERDRPCGPRPRRRRQAGGIAERGGRTR